MFRPYIYIYIYGHTGKQQYLVPGHHLEQELRELCWGEVLPWAERMPSLIALGWKKALADCVGVKECLRWLRLRCGDCVGLKECPGGLRCSDCVGLKECPGAVVMQWKCLYKLWFHLFYIPCTKEMLIQSVVFLVFALACSLGQLARGPPACWRFTGDPETNKTKVFISISFDTWKKWK